MYRRFIQIIIFISSLFLMNFNVNECIADDSLSNYSFDKIEIVKLPLREASGIVVDFRNDYIFVHEDSYNDNAISVFFADGTFKHKIFLDSFKNNDWEDITTDNKGKFWVLDSKHCIYQFLVDEKGFLVPKSIKIIDLPIEIKTLNSEAIDYYEEKNILVIITKGYGNKVIFLNPESGSILLNTQLPATLKIKPSGLTHSSKSGNFFIVAFRGNKIIEISPDFKSIINVLNIKKNLLPQAEGIAFDRNHQLIVVTEKPWYSLFGKSQMIKLIPAGLK